MDRKNKAAQQNLLISIIKNKGGCNAFFEEQIGKVLKNNSARAGGGNSPDLDRRKFIQGPSEFDQKNIWGVFLSEEVSYNDQETR